MNIKAVINNIDNGKAKVSFIRPKSCGDCSSCSGCNIETMDIELNSIEDINIGDVVELEFKTSNMLKATALLYIMPLIMLVVGIIAGNQLQVKYLGRIEEIISFLSGVVFLVLTFIFINFVDKRTRGEELISIKKIEGKYE